MKKLIFIFGLLIVISVFTPGCQKKNRENSDFITLTLWTSNNPTEVEWTRRVVDLWNKENKKVQIKAQPIPEGKSSEEILMAAVIAKTTPDICANVSPAMIEQLRRAKALVCIDEIPELIEFLIKRVPDEALSNSRSPDKHLYHIPWKCNPIAVFYNKEIFEKAGVHPPKNYSQWLFTAAKIKEKLPGIYITFLDSSTTWWQRFFDFYPLYIAASGGKTLIDENGKPDINNEDALKAMTFLSENFEKGYTPMELPPGDAFIEGKIAVKISGPWNVAIIAESKPELEYDVIPIPVPDDYPANAPVYTYGDPKSIGIFSTTKHPAECAKFIMFMCSFENDALFLENCSQMVYRKDMLENERFKRIFEKYPILKKFAAIVPYTRGLDHNAHLLEIFDELSANYIDAILIRKYTPKEAIIKAQKRIENIMLDELENEIK